MKKYSYFLILLLTATTIAANARIIRVNNTPGIVANGTTIFNNFQNAINAALAGDTIHLEPSATNYTSVSIDKQLTIIGVGYFLDPGNTTTPANTGLQAGTLHSIASALTFSSAGANGTRIIGLCFTSTVNIGAASNIFIDRCYFLNAQIIMLNGGVTNNNITIRHCFFHEQGIYAAGGSTPVTNFIFENNIVYGGINANVNVQSLSGNGNIIRNNTFFSSPLASSHSIFANAYVANNIFTSTLTNQTFTDCVMKNNLFRANQPLPPTQVDNQVNLGASIDNIFVGGTGSLDSRLQLQNGSLASGAGVTIAGYTPDCGAFGGPDKYRLSGIPNIPSIYQLNVPVSVGTGTTTMNVTFSTRNNN